MNVNGWADFTDPSGFVDVAALAHENRAQLARDVADANARMAAEGRCIPCRELGKTAPARCIVRYPVGNEIPMCVECCAFVRQEAAESPDDWTAQPEWIKEIA